MKRKALFVGIDKYKNGISQLSCAYNDAKKLSFAFANAGYEVDLIGNEEASQENIISKVEQMTDSLADNDIFVFYFSGHGAELNGIHYLLGIGAQSNLEMLNIGSVTINNLITATRCPGLKRLFILDCCRSSILPSRDVGYTCSANRGRCLDRAIKSTEAAIIPPLILSSCSTNEVAYEDINSGHGFFTEALLNSIGNRNICSFDQFRKSLVINDSPRPQNVSWNGNINMWDDIPLFASWEANDSYDDYAQEYSYSDDENCDNDEDSNENPWMEIITGANRITDPLDFSKIDMPRLMADAYSGYTEAQYLLGTCYLYGIKVNADWKKSEELSFLAAQEGHILAKFNLAWILYNSNDDTDIEFAKEIFDNIYDDLCTCAKEEKHSECQYALGVMYENGITVEQDIKTAVDWYKKSQAQNFPQAVFKWAMCYRDGIIVKEDPYRAFALFKKAETMEVYATYNQLGRCYHNGNGVGCNRTLAKKYFRLAAQHGNRWGAINLFTVYGDCFSDREVQLKKDMKNVIKKYKNRIPNLFDDSHIPSACVKFIDTYDNLLGGYYRNTKQNTPNKQYEFFAIYAYGVSFFKSGKYICWEDMESINAAKDGIMIDDHKLTLSEHIGTTANLIKDLRDLFVEYLDN